VFLKVDTTVSEERVVSVFWVREVT